MQNTNDIQERREFHDSMWKYSTPYLKVSFLIAALLFITGSLIDVIIAPHHFQYSLPIRIVASCFFLVLFLTLSVLFKHWLYTLLCYIAAVFAAPLFIIAVELSLPNGYLYLHSSILIVILAISVIGPYARISIPLIISCILVSEGLVYAIMAAGIQSNSLPDETIINVNTIIHVFAATLAIALVIIDTRKNLLAFIEGKNFAYSARTDELTRISNRRGFQEEFERELKRQQRSGRATGLLMIDIDFFKKINDNHGHNAGDEVLRALVERWSGLLRQTDLLARIGGEEFIVMLPESTAMDAREIAERLRLATAATPLTTAAGMNIPVTVSIGAALIPPDQNVLASAMETVDAALYRAKNNGRNRIEWAHQ